MVDPSLSTAALQMRQRASPKYRSRRMVPKVSVSWGPAGRRESAQQLFLLTSVSPGVDEQSESSEESEEEKAPEEDKEEEEEKKVPTPQEKKRRKDSSDESDSSEESDIDSETSSALFMAVRLSCCRGLGGLDDLLSPQTHVHLCRRRRHPPKGSGSHQGAVQRALAGQELPVQKWRAPLPLCGLQPANWSRVSAQKSLSLGKLLAATSFCTPAVADLGPTPT